MSKSETLDALMESAIFSFADNGYAGASLRDIAGNAHVPLSTIHFYFGSKAELFAAVARRAWMEIDADRSERLREAMDGNEEAASLESLVHALAYPVVRRALSRNPRDLAQLFVLRSHTARHERLDERMLDVADRSMVRWVDAMAQRCPALSRQDMVWAFSFVIGAIYSWQLIDHRYDRMLGSDCERSDEDVTRDIVDFCCSGIEAMARRRAAASN